eukprot:6172081-Pleurochrysis_carterae.AAC.1
MAMATVGGRHPEACNSVAAQCEWVKPKFATSLVAKSATEARQRILPAATRLSCIHAATARLGETSGVADGALRGASACGVDAAAAGREAGAASCVRKLRVAWSIGGTGV